MGRSTSRFLYLEERIEIPENVSVEISGRRVKVSGPKGSIEKDFSFARSVIIEKSGNEIIVKSYLGRSREKAIVRTIASRIRNMVRGVRGGYRYYLKIIFTHFPMNVSVEDGKVVIRRILGGSDVRIAKILEGVKVEIKDRDIIVEGVDLEAVSQTAANIERAARITGFDKRVVMDGIYIYKREVIEG
ncbi:MAG: 50S ribosomal protein L6 [Sulfolobales archaeon]